jgi:TolB-like protein
VQSIGAEQAQVTGPTPVETHAPARPALPLPDRPAIAVLPFTNMSGDPEQEYFSDGISEDLITALSKLR